MSHRNNHCVWISKKKFLTKMDDVGNLCQPSEGEVPIATPGVTNGKNM